MKISLVILICHFRTIGHTTMFDIQSYLLDIIEKEFVG